MYTYKSLYGLKVGRGLLSQNDSYLVFDNLIAAYEKQKELQEFIPCEPIDLYDYYKEYRNIKENFKDFYNHVSELIHNNDPLLSLQK